MASPQRIAHLFDTNSPHHAESAPNVSALLPSSIGVRPETMSFRELDVDYDPQARIMFHYMKPVGRPSFSPSMLREILAFQQALIRNFPERENDASLAVDYVVFGSRAPGSFNLGGDLRLFADCIRNGDRETLCAYAYACIDPLYQKVINLGLPVLSIALVQGDALGGGFEAALAEDIIIAERSAKFGLPEILFNLFPGMGAYSFLSRRLDPVRAERMILSGKIYTAEELYEMGLVAVLAEDGKGEQALYDYVDANKRRYQATRAVLGARQVANPVRYDELIDITNHWVDAALSLSPADLRKMERLAAAQERRGAAAAV